MNPCRKALHTPADRLMNPGLSLTLGDGVRLLPSGPPKPFSGRQGSRPQEVEVRPPVALTLYELELGDEAFHGSVGPLLREPRSDRAKILPQAGGELLH